MSIWNKVLIWLIALALLPLFYMSARALKTYKYWAERVIALERGVAKQQDENQALVLGNRQLQTEMHKWLVERGRVWRKVLPTARPAGKVEVSIDNPIPHKIEAATRLFAFEEGSLETEPAANGHDLFQHRTADDLKALAGSHYLGEFRAVEVADKRVVLEPARKLTERETTRLDASKGPWVLYEVMPPDRHDLFAGLSPEQLKAVFPEESAPEYVRDGGPKAESDPPDRVVDGKYDRFLRHYETLFEDLAVVRTVLADLQESYSRDEQYMKEAVAGAKKQQESIELEKAKAQGQRKVAFHERDRVAEHGKQVQAKLDAILKALSDQIEANRSTALEIERAQRKAAQIIDRRLPQRGGTMAQIGTGSVN